MKLTTKKSTVKIHRDLPHFLPCSVSNVRVRGWQMIKHFEGGYIEVRAWETINATDILVLLGIVKAFQDRQGDIREGEKYKNSDIERKAIMIRIKLKQFDKLYSKLKNYKLIEDTLKRLVSLVEWHHEDNGNVFQVRYLLDFVIKEEDGIKYLTLMLNKAFYDKCLAEGWVINYEKLQSIKGQVARTLFFYISAQRNTAFYQNTLERKLGLEGNPTDIRKILRKSFKEIEQKGYIKYFNDKKTDEGYLFGFRWA